MGIWCFANEKTPSRVFVINPAPCRRFVLLASVAVFVLFSCHRVSVKEASRLLGRTVPTFRMIIEQFGWEWHEFTRALRGLDKELFEELLNHARRHATAGHNMPNPNPFEPIVMSILVEHEKELRRLRKQYQVAEGASGEMKTCPRCGGVNPVESYYKNGVKEEGSHILCEDCRQGLFFD